jgi:hypothetical protein
MSFSLKVFEGSLREIFFQKVSLNIKEFQPVPCRAKKAG